MIHSLENRNKMIFSLCTHLAVVAKYKTIGKKTGSARENLVKNEAEEPGAKSLKETEVEKLKAFVPFEVYELLHKKRRE